MSKPSNMKDEAERIERFLVAFNRIEKAMRQEAGAASETTFSGILRAFGRANRKWPHTETMTVFARIRNFVVHESVRVGEKLVVPSTSAVLHIEGICNQLTKSRTAYEEFQREVISISDKDTLASVLAKINSLFFSQFPVYSGSKFVGLLTENGITRWLASHSTKESTLLDSEDVQVIEVLGNQESHANVAFVGRTIPVWKLQEFFSMQPLLEAAIVTHSGKKSEAPLGIATRWDVASLPLSFGQ